MNTPTNARVHSESASHWYRQDGSPCHQVPKAKGGGMRNTTIADARKQQLVPSVTSILDLLHKEALVAWRIEQAVLAVATTPRIQGEGDDDFIHRVLHAERVQDQESQKARDIGTRIHRAIEKLFAGGPVGDPEIEDWVMPAYQFALASGNWNASELSLANSEFGGTLDLVQNSMDGSRRILTDFKSTKKLPAKGAWPEHRLQLAAYAKLYRDRIDCPFPIDTRNIYISTVDQGMFVCCEHEPGSWQSAYENGFAPLLKHWQWAREYRPTPLAASGS